MWSLFAYAVAVATLIYLLSKAWGIIATPGMGPRLSISISVIIRLLIPVVLLGSGFVLEPALLGILQGNSGALQEQLEGVSRAIAAGLGLGSVVAIAADQAANLHDRVINTAVATVLALVLFDNFSSILIGPQGRTWVFSMLSDVVGGALGGATIGLITEWLLRKEQVQLSEHQA